MTNCAGAILAGGLSSRMGQDKAALKFHGKSLLENMVLLLQKAGITQIYISSADFIPDIIPDCGPLGGVHAILCHDEAMHDHLLFVPIDMPGLTPALLKKLVNAPESEDLVHFSTSKMPFRLSSKAKWGHLVYSLLSRKNDYSLGHFQNQIANKHILEALSEDAPAFVNINSPQDWQDFQKRKEDETEN